MMNWMLLKAKMAWGLTWNGSTMPINWRVVIDGLILTALLCAVLALVDAISEHAEMADKGARSVYMAEGQQQ